MRIFLKILFYVLLPVILKPSTTTKTQDFKL